MISSDYEQSNFGKHIIRFPPLKLKALGSTVEESVQLNLTTDIKVGGSKD